MKPEPRQSLTREEEMNHSMNRGLAVLTIGGMSFCYGLINVSPTTKATSSPVEWLFWGGAIVVIIGVVLVFASALAMETSPIVD